MVYVLKDLSYTITLSVDTDTCYKFFLLLIASTWNESRQISFA